MRINGYSLWWDSGITLSLVRLSRPCLYLLYISLEFPGPLSVHSVNKSIMLGTGDTEVGKVDEDPAFVEYVFYGGGCQNMLYRHISGGSGGREGSYMTTLYWLSRKTLSKEVTLSSRRECREKKRAQEANR